MIVPSLHNIFPMYPWRYFASLSSGSPQAPGPLTPTELPPLMPLRTSYNSIQCCHLPLAGRASTFPTTSYIYDVGRYLRITMVLLILPNVLGYLARIISLLFFSPFPVLVHEGFHHSCHPSYHSHAPPLSGYACVNSLEAYCYPIITLSRIQKRTWRSLLRLHPPSSECRYEYGSCRRPFRLL